MNRNTSSISGKKEDKSECARELKMKAREREIKRDGEREFGNRNMIPNKIKKYDESLAL